MADHYRGKGFVKTGLHYRSANYTMVRKVEICENPNPWYKTWFPPLTNFYFSNDDWQLEHYYWSIKDEKKLKKMMTDLTQQSQQSDTN